MTNSAEDGSLEEVVRLLTRLCAKLDQHNDYYRNLESNNFDIRREEINVTSFEVRNLLTKCNRKNKKKKSKLSRKSVPRRIRLKLCPKNVPDYVENIVSPKIKIISTKIVYNLHRYPLLHNRMIRSDIFTHLSYSKLVKFKVFFA